MSRSLINVFFYAFLIPLLSFSQEIPIGTWKVHLPYNNGVALAQTGDKIYCATKSGVYYFNVIDNSITRLSKQDGFSDISVNDIAYHEGTQTLIIGYSSGNIDMVKESKITILSDIKNKMIPGSKSINTIKFFENLAYFACNFGIVVFDLEKNEFKESYVDIGPNGASPEVYDILFSNKSIYAATNLGVLASNINSPNLMDYKYWFLFDNSNLGTINKSNSLAFFNNKIYASLNDSSLYFLSDSIWQNESSRSWSILYLNSINNNLVITQDNEIVIMDTLNNFTTKEKNWWMPDPGKAIMDKDNVLWVADRSKGLVKSVNNSFWNFRPEGPESNKVFDIDISNDKVWLGTGGVDLSWRNLFYNEGVYSYINNEWESFTRFNISGLDTINFTDVVAIGISPITENVFAGSFYGGLVELNFNQGLVNHYNPYNSTLDWNFNLLQIDSAKKACKISDLTFDINNNLWVTNYGAPNPISVLQTDGKWKSFNFGTLTSGSYSVGDIIIDNNGYKWVLLTTGKDGILVFDDRGTITDESDDQFRLLSTGEGNGDLPSNGVHSIAMDKNGEIWVGTDKGIAVFYAPYLIFTDENSDAQQIFVEVDGYTAYLLETETVSSIAIDGANRKWIGTFNGIWLTNENGTEVIHQFTTTNSPLLSDAITSIRINENNGEVFIGTDQGLISYRGTATEGTVSHKDVLIFPNPIRENYTGTIAIKGLVENANVKITDISGTLIYETTALGGQAIWDGNNYNKQRASTGVYLVISSSKDGSETFVGKLLFIN